MDSLLHVETKTFALGDNMLLCQFIDLPGALLSQARFFVADCAAVFLVFDLTSQDSLEALLPVAKLLTMQAAAPISQQPPQPNRKFSALFLIGNKCDAVPSDRRGVASRHALDFASTFGLQFFETRSARF